MRRCGHPQRARGHPQRARQRRRAKYLSCSHSYLVDTLTTVPNTYLHIDMTHCSVDEFPDLFDGVHASEDVEIKLARLDATKCATSTFSSSAARRMPRSMCCASAT